MKIGYARISTRDQSLQLQVDALEAAGCEKIYQEIASGAKTARLVLDDLLNNAREGDTLMVWKLDRLARSLRHFMQIIDVLAKKNVDFVSLTQKIDTSTAIGKSMFHMIAIMGELERDIIVERVNAGLKSARARGRLGGRPRGLPRGAEEKAKVAKTLYLNGSLSIRTISSQLNISQSTLYRYLRHLNVEIGKYEFHNKEI